MGHRGHQGTQGDTGGHKGHREHRGTQWDTGDTRDKEGEKGHRGTQGDTGEHKAHKGHGGNRRTQGNTGDTRDTHAVCCEDYYFPEVKFKLFIVCITRRTGRTVRKVMGGGGWGFGEKNKKNLRKGNCQEIKFMQKEGPIVTFSESLSFRNQQYYQAQYEKTKITFFLLKGDN